MRAVLYARLSRDRDGLLARVIHLLDDERSVGLGELG